MTSELNGGPSGAIVPIPGSTDSHHAIITLAIGMRR
jgi:hypothetical protein